MNNDHDNDHVPTIISYVLVQELRLYLLYNQSNNEFKTIDWIFYQIQFVILSTLFFYINLISLTPIFDKVMVFLAHFLKTIGT